MDTKLTPRDIIDSSKRIVIKIGTESLIKDGQVDTEWVDAFIEDVINLRKQEKEIFVVTSGAIGLARGLAGIPAHIPTKDLPLDEQQKLSTVGQIALMQAYWLPLQKHGFFPQQILLTSDVVDNKKQVQNLRNTAWLKAGSYPFFEKIIPFFNEDDALATEEITFGDNDGLGAIVTKLLEADAYILLSKEDGLLTDNPKKNPNARLIPFVADASEAFRFANDDINGLSRGGMRSKLKAAFNASAAGAHVILAKGQGVIHCLRKLSGNEDGYQSTVFAPLPVHEAA